MTFVMRPSYNEQFDCSVTKSFSSSSETHPVMATSIFLLLVAAPAPSLLVGCACCLCQSATCRCCPSASCAIPLHLTWVAVLICRTCNSSADLCGYLNPRLWLTLCLIFLVSFVGSAFQWFICLITCLPVFDPGCTWPALVIDSQ